VTLVLLHPVGLDADCWQFLDPDLAHAGKPEMLGHGRRITERGTWSLTAGADEVAASFAPPLDLVGVSMGGLIAQHIALRHPSKVRSVVLACTSAVAHRDRLLERAQAVLDGGMASVLDSTLQRWFTSSALAQPAHPGVAYARQRLLSDDPEAFARTWRAMAEHNTLDELSRITALVTVVVGTHDAASPAEGLREIQRRLPNSRLEFVEGPHMLQLETPERFSDTIRRHLAWVERLAT